MDIITVMAYWAGIFYLLNKIFFLFTEITKQEKLSEKWRITSWVVYIIGLPAWVFIFISERNWIAAFIEAGGLPAMIIGLYIAIRGLGKEPDWLHYIAKTAIVIGIILSLYDFGGLTVLTQYLELAMVIGFLFGTYLLAQKKLNGYLWFMLMNASNAVLMYVQNYNGLMWQQIASLSIVLAAYLIKKAKQKSLSKA